MQRISPETHEQLLNSGCQLISAKTSHGVEFLTASGIIYVLAGFIIVVANYVAKMGEPRVEMNQSKRKIITKMSVKGEDRQKQTSNAPPSKPQKGRASTTNRPPQQKKESTSSRPPTPPSSPFDNRSPQRSRKISRVTFDGVDNPSFIKVDMDSRRNTDDACHANGNGNTSDNG